MDSVLQYDEGMAYEALQEVMTQTIAYFSHALHSNEDAEKTAVIADIITKLIDYKRIITPEKSSYDEALAYLIELREQWHL